MDTATTQAGVHGAGIVVVADDLSVCRAIERTIGELSIHALTRVGLTQVLVALRVVHRIAGHRITRRYTHIVLTRIVAQALIGDRGRTVCVCGTAASGRRRCGRASTAIAHIVGQTIVVDRGCTLVAVHWLVTVDTALAG